MPPVHARLAAVAVLAVATAVPGPAAGQLVSSVFVRGLNAPLAFVQDPSDPSTQYVAEQGGRIRVVQSGILLPTDFLDLSAVVTAGGERGLLGLAFPPDYAVSGRFYVNFTDVNGDTVVARFKRSANRLRADPGSRFDLLWSTGERVIRQPFANHNGGNLVFGPDRYLYVGMGDGGAGDDPANRAQDPQTLLGKMLRIDVGVPDSDPKGFRVPPDNPFLDGQPVAAPPEIWDFGLRNPWRFSFDPPALGGTGALVIGDVGQNDFEEVDYEPAQAHGARNYGWRIREGAHPHIATLPPAFLPLTDPIFDYDHTVGFSVTGGFVYRGRALGTGFNGRYFYADLSGRVWSVGLQIDPGSGEAAVFDRREHTAELGGSAVLGSISSFGIDAAGELYVVNYGGGTIVRILSSLPPCCGTSGGLGDYDGDGRTEMAVFRPSTSGWWLLQSGTGYTSSVAKVWGSQAAGDTPVPGDYDGDGRTDPAFWRPATGTWWALLSGTNDTTYLARTWGTQATGDILVPGDYDGDGRTDPAFWRPSTGTWWVLLSSTNYTTYLARSWGVQAAGDIPVPGDYDGDGKADLAFWRPTTGTWWVLLSGTNFTTYLATSWGSQTGDIPAPGDYDGDGRTDLAFWRPSAGAWWVLLSGSNYTTYLTRQWGDQALGDVPAPGDYDGDGRTDLAFWRPSAGTWWVLLSGTNYTTSLARQWGVQAAGDMPLR